MSDKTRAAIDRLESDVERYAEAMSKGTPEEKANALEEMVTEVRRNPWRGMALVARVAEWNVVLSAAAKVLSVNSDQPHEYDMGIQRLSDTLEGCAFAHGEMTS